MIGLRAFLFSLSSLLIFDSKVFAAEFGLFGAPVPNSTPTTQPQTAPPPSGGDGGGGSSSGGGGGGGGEPAAPAPQGLNATYFNGRNLQGSFVNRIDLFIGYNWGYGSPHLSINRDNFSVRWTGWVEAPHTGKYTFYAKTDDGVRVWVGGRLIINRWRIKSAYELRGNIDLVAGQRYPITVEYFEYKYRAQAWLFWSATTNQTYEAKNRKGEMLYYRSGKNKGKPITRTRRVTLMVKQLVPHTLLTPW